MAGDPPSAAREPLYGVTIGEGFGGFLAPVPGRGTLGVVIVHEIFGVTSKIRRYCQLFAGAGYPAIAPDLYWRVQPGLEFPYSGDGIRDAIGMLRNFDEAAAVNDLAAAADALRKEGVKQVALVGFCLGGKLALMSLGEGSADGAVAFYPTRLEERPDLLAQLSGPAQFHFGALDTHIPASVVDQAQAVARERAGVEVHVYEGADHAFFRADLRDQASQLAFDRTKQFLRSLGGARSG